MAGPTNGQAVALKFDSDFADDTLLLETKSWAN
ncbi:hypothetical protein L195_g064748, partial [Trifolium pratense]